MRAARRGFFRVGGDLFFSVLFLILVFDIDVSMRVVVMGMFRFFFFFRGSETLVMVTGFASEILIFGNLICS